MSQRENIPPLSLWFKRLPYVWPLKTDTTKTEELKKLVMRDILNTVCILWVCHTQQAPGFSKRLQLRLIKSIQKSNLCGGCDGFLAHHTSPAGNATEGCLITVTYSVANESPGSFCQGITFFGIRPPHRLPQAGSHCEGVSSSAFDLSFITRYRLRKQMCGKLGEGEGT